MNYFVTKYVSEQGNLNPPAKPVLTASLKTTRVGGESRDFDGGKITKERKRHIITETMGLLLGVVVHTANIHNSKGVSDVIASQKARFSRLTKIVTDGCDREDQNHFRLGT